MPQKVDKGYVWDGEFSNRPHACNLGRNVWLVAAPGDTRHYIVDLDEKVCTCAKMHGCEHIVLARKERAFIIRSGYATRNGREIIIPDADRLVIAQLKKAFRQSMKAMSEAAQ